MKIQSVEIKNYKSIRHLVIEQVENACIFVGKNNTGKTAILNAIRAVLGDKKISPGQFFDSSKNMEVKMTLEVSQEDLKQLFERGVVSKYKNYEDWFQEFCERIPDYQENMLTFTYTVNPEGREKYRDSVHKNNPYIPLVLPKMYYINHNRYMKEFHQALLSNLGGTEFAALKDNRCMFDKSRPCNQCFQCMGVIEKKQAAQMNLFETAKLMEYKMFQLNLESFSEKVNWYFRQNGAKGQKILYQAKYNPESVFQIESVLHNEDRDTITNINSMGAGSRSIYLLSMLEAYVEESSCLPCIIMIEDPEAYLHPQMQKTASEILYRLAKKNQVVFSTLSPNMIFNFSSKQIKQVVLDEEYSTKVTENTDIDQILDDLGYTANDLMNVSFVFIVEGKQDSNRLPLLLEKYYSEIYDDEGKLQRISIIATNSCTNIKTYANLKYINKLYLKDQFLMIRDSDGKNPKHLVKQLCNYYKARDREDVDKLPRVTERNVLVLKYYSFENYFLDPKVMAEIGVVKSEEDFYNILYKKYKDYLYKIPSVRRLCRYKNMRIHSKEDLKKNMELIKIYVRGHNLFDIFYGRCRSELTDVLKRYIDAAPRENFKDILDAIDSFVYFENRRKL